MILGKTEDEIVQLAVIYQSEMTDGVVQYNYETGELVGAGFTTGTVENPNNPFIEVFRLPQGERGEIDCRCWETGECPFADENGVYNEDITVPLYGTRVNCCINAYVDNDFDDDFEDNFKEGVEEQIREVLTEYLGDTLKMLEDIRIELLGLDKPYERINAVFDNWENEVLDNYIDNAMENGLNITETDAVGYLDAEVEYLIFLTYKPELEVMKTVRRLLEERKIEETFNTLH